MASCQENKAHRGRHPGQARRTHLQRGEARVQARILCSQRLRGVGQVAQCLALPPLLLLQLRHCQGVALLAALLLPLG